MATRKAYEGSVSTTGGVAKTRENGYIGSKFVGIPGQAAAPAALPAEAPAAPPPAPAPVNTTPSSPTPARLHTMSAFDEPYDADLAQAEANRAYELGQAPDSRVAPRAAPPPAPVPAPAPGANASNYTATDFGGGNVDQQNRQIGDARSAPAPLGFDANKWKAGGDTHKYRGGTILAAGGSIGDILNDPQFKGPPPWTTGSDPNDDIIESPEGSQYDVWYDFGGRNQRPQWQYKGGGPKGTRNDGIVGNDPNGGAMAAARSTRGGSDPRLHDGVKGNAGTPIAGGGGGGTGGAGGNDFLAMITALLNGRGTGSGTGTTPIDPGGLPGPAAPAPPPMYTPPAIGQPNRRQYQSLLGRGY